MTDSAPPIASVAPGSLPLAGCRILDLSRILAGPLATQQLADLGADVIKVESTQGGDATRAWGPPFLPDGRSAYHLSCNRGKRSIAVNLAHAAGQDIVERLAARADGLIENFRRGQLAAWGLDLARLRATHPRLHTVTISAFGTSGARAAEPGYDALMQAMSGLMSITGPKDGEWSKVGVAVVDIAAGLFAGTALASLLSGRGNSGRRVRPPDDRHLEVSLYDAAMSILANVASNVLVQGEDAGRHGNQHPSIVPYQVFECKNGPLFIGVGSDAQWRALCAALGREEWLELSDWSQNDGRVAAREVLTRTLAAEISNRDRTTLAQQLRELGVPAGPLQTVGEALRDEVFASRSGVQVCADGTPLVSSPIRRCGDLPLPIGRPPPHLGEQTRKVLLEAAYSDAEVDALLEARIVSASPSDSGDFPRPR